MKVPRPLHLLMFAALVFPCNSGYAEVRLPKLLSTGMILQRERPARIWGWAEPKENIRVSLNSDTSLATAADRDGEWYLTLPAMPAGGPHTLTIEGENTIVLNDIYFGDVWVASGQSNMQTPMSRVEEKFPDEVARANFPLIRQFTVPRTLRFDRPAEDFNGGEWQPSTPQFLPSHSAVAYFFAKKIHREQAVPIGILSANMGGSAAECWLGEEALKKYPAEYQTAKKLQNAAYLQFLKDADQKEAEAWFTGLNNSDKGLQSELHWYDERYDHRAWPTIQVPSRWEEQGIAPMSGIVWFRKTVTLPPGVENQAALLRLGTIVDADTAYINGVEVGTTAYRYPPRRYKIEPGILKAGKNTLTLRVQVDNRAGEFIEQMPYYLQVGEHRVDLTGPWHFKIGTLVEPPKPRRYIPWSQPLGCYNAMLAPLFNLQIKGVIWYQGESNAGRPQQYAGMFPHLIEHWRHQWQQGDFPFLFVQLPNYLMTGIPAGKSGWPETRFAQFQTLKKVDNTAMAVTIDVGEWNDLHPLDKKSVGERLALAAQALAYGKKDLVYAGPLFKSARTRGNTVLIDFNFVGGGLMTKGKKPGGFQLAGRDGKFRPAQASITGNRVIVQHPDIQRPSAVRYAWEDNPAREGLLYNQEGLPASPFEAKL